MGRAERGAMHRGPLHRGRRIGEGRRKKTENNPGFNRVAVCAGCASDWSEYLPGRPGEWAREPAKVSPDCCVAEKLADRKGCAERVLRRKNRPAKRCASRRAISSPLMPLRLPHQPTGVSPSPDFLPGLSAGDCLRFSSCRSGSLLFSLSLCWAGFGCARSGASSCLVSLIAGSPCLKYCGESSNWRACSDYRKLRVRRPHILRHRRADFPVLRNFLGGRQ